MPSLMNIIIQIGIMTEQTLKGFQVVKPLSLGMNIERRSSEMMMSRTFPMKKKVDAMYDINTHLLIRANMSFLKPVYLVE